MALVFLLIICSTSRKSTLLCTTLWLEMAIFTVPFQCIDIESKQHSSKSRICEFSSTEKIWHLRRAYFVCVPICLLVCLVRPFISSRSVCRPDCLSLCLLIYMCVCLSICLNCLSVILGCVSVCLSCLSAVYLRELSLCLSVWFFCLLGLIIRQSYFSVYLFVGSVCLYCMASCLLFICLSSLSACLVCLFSVSGSSVCLSFCAVLILMT